VSRRGLRTQIGTFGQIAATDLGGCYRATTRVRDLDRRLRRVTASGPTPRAAPARLKARLAERPGHGSAGTGPSSGFDALCELWLADLALGDIPEGTKQNYILRQVKREENPEAPSRHELAAVFTTPRRPWRALNLDK